MTPKGRKSFPLKLDENPRLRSNVILRALDKQEFFPVRNDISMLQAVTPGRLERSPKLPRWNRFSFLHKQFPVWCSFSTSFIGLES